MVKREKIRRINFYAGPCAGKSTLTSYTHWKLKKKDYDVGLIQEYVKTWAYEGRIPFSFDQWYIFGKQSHEEDRQLRCKPDGKSGEELVVTDSPIFLSVCYAKKNNTPGWQQHVVLSNIFDEKYPSLNFFIKRPKKYKQVGRFQDRACAVEMDRYIKATLEEFGQPYIEIGCSSYKRLINTIEKHL